MKELDHPLHRYLMFLSEHLTDEQRQEIINLDPELKKTDELLLKLSADEDTFRLYEAREYALIERNSIIAGGIQKGKEIGLEIGKELGIEIGIDKGIELRNRELAKRFSTDGYDIEQIAKLLFMTKDDVIQLMKQSN